ncbi:MAG TPA: hypothetical protein VGL77_03435 [Armatimonadota bacterium]|jgi:hypothetical protein
MTAPTRRRRGCSPFTLLGCGCGLLAGLGLVCIFIIMTIQLVKERYDVTWKRQYFAECQDNLRYLKSAINNYQQDHHHLPAHLGDLSASYLDRSSRLHCPLELLGHGKPYIYTPNGVGPTAPLITCPNHGQGPLILQHNGLIHLPSPILRR